MKIWLEEANKVVNQDGGELNQEKAKQYSRDLWLNDKWEGANYPLSWLIDKFKPVPDWHD